MTVEYYLFICSLFNGALSNSGYMASRDKIVNNELGRTWKEVAVA
jgi:hypothetical protein